MRLHRAATCLAGAILSVAANASATETAPRSTALGERFYRQGITVSGDAVPATVQGDLVVRSTTMPCVDCHNRSGWGSGEGSLMVPAVVGSVLFRAVALGNPQVGYQTTGAGTRPAYDDQTLRRALRDGIDPAGRTLSATMPRYALGDTDLSVLAAYLRTLSAAPPPGVTETTVHLATITSREVDARQREAMLSVLRAFVNAKNAGTRNEARRREHGGWDMKPHDDLFRRWELHEWSVQGDPRGWPAQLRQQYASQPVFAVVSGLAPGGWKPVHAFCEETRLPCIFPETALPPGADGDEGFYSVYFSPGLALEAAALAEHIRNAPAPPDAIELLQILRCGGPAEDAARELAAALGPDTPVRTHCVQGAAALTAAAMPDTADARALVLWLGSADLAGFAAATAASDGWRRIDRVYLSASMLAEDLRDLPGPLLARAVLLDPFVPPDEFDRHAARSLVWLKSRGVATPDRRVSVNAFFAVSTVAEALTYPRALASREYFIEQIEHAVGRSPLPSAYPALSLGPRRRFASLGCYVLQFPADPRGSFTKLGPWVVPELRRKETR